MNNNTADSVLTGLLLIIMPALVIANDYVPPPTGPYQSSVVINSVEKYSVEQPQVYKFPPADLVDEEYSAESFIDSPTSSAATQYEAPMDVPSPASVNQSVYYDTGQGAANVDSMLPPVSTPGYTPYNNPWDAPATSATVQPSYPPGYQTEIWGYPQGAYQNQYPYNYSNGYNPANNSNYGMPGPWSMMPNNPFFSGQ